jgi:hypothetical protein
MSFFLFQSPFSFRLSLPRARPPSPMMKTPKRRCNNMEVENSIAIQMDYVRAGEQGGDDRSNQNSVIARHKQD